MNEQIKLLIGPGHDIRAKLENARALFEQAGEELSVAPGMPALLRQYRRAVEADWDAMRVHGVVAECTRCAVEDGGSCCGRGIEDKFDSVLLMINLMLGAKLPESRYDPEGCWFLGERGCTIPARHIICINYMCRRLCDSLDMPAIQAVQGAMGVEADLVFLLEEKIKAWLARHGYR